MVARAECLDHRAPLRQHQWRSETPVPGTGLINATTAATRSVLIKGCTHVFGARDQKKRARTGVHRNHAMVHRVARGTSPTTRANEHVGFDAPRQSKAHSIVSRHE